MYATEILSDERSLVLRLIKGMRMLFASFMLPIRIV